MPCLLFFGDVGMGKTEIVRKFVRDHSGIPRFSHQSCGYSAAAVGARSGSWRRGDEILASPEWLAVRQAPPAVRLSVCQDRWTQIRAISNRPRSQDLWIINQDLWIDAQDHWTISV